MGIQTDCGVHCCASERHPPHVTHEPPSARARRLHPLRRRPDRPDRTLYRPTKWSHLPHPMRVAAAVLRRILHHSPCKICVTSPSRHSLNQRGVLWQAEKL
eukprot:5400001-Prymnesium_polylepis.2